MADDPAFPWREAMAFGFGRLALSSAAFWALTPRELAAAIEGTGGSRPVPIDRAGLEALSARYPDAGSAVKAAAPGARHHEGT